MGIVAVGSIRRESNPDVTLPAIDIRVPYPGADPEEVEEGVSQKLEAAIDGLQGVKRYFTTSQEGMSRIEIEVDGSEDDDKEPDVGDNEDEGNDEPDYDNEAGWHRLSRRPSH